MKELEDKIFKIDNNLNDLKEKKNQISNAQLVILKKIEALSISDLMDSETVSMAKTRIKDIQQLLLPVSKKTLKTLYGNPFVSYGIGGLVFSMSAIKPIIIKSLAVTTRGPGDYYITIKRIFGSTSDADKNKQSWPILLNKTLINFASTSQPTVIWNGEIKLDKGQCISWAVSNFGNGNMGELVAHSTEKNTITDDHLIISPCAFLDRTQEFALYPANEYMSLGFIGKVEYWVQ